MTTHRAPNVERRAFSGSVANIASIAAILLQNLALVPVLLHCWTPGTYGVWITLLAVQSLLFNVNYGQEAYVGYESARLLHKDRAALPDVIGAGIFLGIALGLLEVGLIIALGLTHFTRLLGIPAESGSGDEWKFLVVIVGSWVGFGSAANVLVRIAYALGFYSTFTLYSVFFRVLVTLAIAISATCGAGLQGAAIAYGLATLLTQATLMALALRLLRQHSVAIARPRLALISGILKNGAVLSGTSLLDAFSNNGLLTIISSVLTPRFVPSFSTLRTVANTANQGVGVIMHPLDPDIIRYRARNEFHKLSEIFGVCWAIAGSSINLGLCLLPLFIEPLYRVWTRGKLSFDLPLFSLLALSVALRTFGHPAMAYLQATNAISAQARISVIRAALVISLSLVLIHPLGLFGVGAALAISELIGAAALPVWYAMQAFAASDIRFPKQRMLKAIASVTVVGITFATCCRYPALKGGICSAACLTIAILAWVQWVMLHVETRGRMLSILHIPKWSTQSNPLADEPIGKVESALR